MIRWNNLRDEGLLCIALLAITLRHLRKEWLPFVIAAESVSILIYLIQISRRSMKDIEREDRDERNRMIQEKASWYSRQAEDWTLLGLSVFFTVFLHEYKIGYALMFFMVGRYWLSFGIRLWLNRKY